MIKNYLKDQAIVYNYIEEREAAASEQDCEIMPAIDRITDTLNELERFASKHLELSEDMRDYLYGDDDDEDDEDEEDGSDLE